MVHVSSFIATLALVAAPLVSARPASSSRNAAPNAARSATSSALGTKVTPVFTPEALDLPDASEAAALMARMFGSGFGKRALDFDASPELNERGIIGDTDVKAFVKRATNTTCLDSTATAYQISALFYYGGAGTVVSLCPGAQISLNQTIQLFYANQELSTQGYPTDDTRALLTVASSAMSVAIYGSCGNCDNIVIRNIQVNGNRPGLGYLSTGSALLELGGDNTGQTVQECHLYEPRGWSALHGIEGTNLYCSGMQILNNQVGPSGNSPNNGAQFKRDSTVYPPGQWADGISMACKGSTVTGNTVTDATDGGIVIFGAPGTLVQGNTIIAETRHLLGGINAVDFAPFSGTFVGTVVQGNTINADTTFIKVGIAIGPLVWGTDNTTADRTYGGTFQGNTFTSGSSGYFGYGVGMSAHNGATVLDNDASSANFGGEESVSCFGPTYTPTPQAFVYDPSNTPNATLQNNFVAHQAVLLICNEPGPIVTRGPATALDTSKYAKTTTTMNAAQSLASVLSARLALASQRAALAEANAQKLAAALQSRLAAAVSKSKNAARNVVDLKDLIPRETANALPSRETPKVVAPVFPGRQ
ncbi:hypothetical protein MNV49_003642 [Pseudohyphozyma bogoriensis]|nr:hypothetical protein MNV49_003642 [Pseudohyphozyma bogoriensis]